MLRERTLRPSEQNIANKQRFILAAKRWRGISRLHAHLSLPGSANLALLKGNTRTTLVRHESGNPSGSVSLLHVSSEITTMVASEGSLHAASRCDTWSARRNVTHDEQACSGVLQSPRAGQAQNMLMAFDQRETIAVSVHKSTE